uniref:Glucosylceramidase n=1 Tax=Meloidogyne incognita TaxID=6306 RepID=A0A914NQW9_MELIC
MDLEHLQLGKLKFQIKQWKNCSFNDTIGLSILRIRISEDKNWSDELANAKNALKYNAKVFASPWNPPHSMKTINSADGGSLKLDQYDNYADYLQSFIDYMNKNNAKLYAISIQNEPDSGWTKWTPQQIVNFLKTSAKRITGTKIMAAESCGFNPTFTNAILNDPEAAKRIDILAGHIYNIINGQALIYDQTKAQQMGKSVWMTEFYTGGKDWKSVIELGKSIHDCIAKHNYQAYIHWWLNDNSPNMMITEKNGEINSKGYVLGQFAKFIKPGFVRVDANTQDNNNLFVSAYKGQNKIVIVVVNMGSTISQQFSINSSLYL